MKSPFLNWLFEIPWWLPAGLIVAGVVVWVTGNNHRKRQWMAAGVALAVLGAALVAISYFGESDREQVVRKTRELVRAVNDGKWQETAGPLLHPDVTLYDWGGRDRLVNEGARHADRVKSAGVSSIQMIEWDLGIRERVLVTAEAKQAAGQSLPITWELDWVPGDNGWQLRDARCVGFGPFPADTIIRYFRD